MTSSVRSDCSESHTNPMVTISGQFRSTRRILMLWPQSLCRTEGGRKEKPGGRGENSHFKLESRCHQSRFTCLTTESVKNWRSFNIRVVWWKPRWLLTRWPLNVSQNRWLVSETVCSICAGRPRSSQHQQSDGKTSLATIYIPQLPTLFHSELSQEQTAAQILSIPVDFSSKWRPHLPACDIQL